MMAVILAAIMLLFSVPVRSIHALYHEHHEEEVCEGHETNEFVEECHNDAHLEILKAKHCEHQHLKSKIDCNWCKFLKQLKEYHYQSSFEDQLIVSFHDDDVARLLKQIESHHEFVFNTRGPPSLT